MYTVGQLARICFVSTKTLRHYDTIGLLRPAAVGPDNQYRYYTREQIPVLRRIIYLREIGLGLEVIREVMRSGALADPVRLAGILSERAQGLRGEISAQQQVLERLQTAVADLQSTGGVPVMTEIAVTIKELPSINAVGVRRRVSTREHPSLFEAVYTKLAGRKPAGPCMTLYHDPEFDPECSDTEVLVPVESGAEQTLPAVKAATCIHVGPYDQVGATYGAIFDWVTGRGYKFAGPPREVYLVTPADVKSPAEYVTEIQIPIE
ncbi:MAG TPA: MerR family transcriptional regulator [Symbiobacteriaceae bacterium]|nr:MerR family transcriptional regulator [Symbiobacteriaceae bacterium]